MRKNDGQVLVAFLLLLPLLFLILIALLDYGFLFIQKRKIDNVVNEALVYASKNEANSSLEEEISTFLNQNVSDISSLQTVKEKEYFEIKMTCKLTKTFIKGLKNNSYTIIKRKRYHREEDFNGT